MVRLGARLDAGESGRDSQIKARRFISAGSTLSEADFSKTTRPSDSVNYRSLISLPVPLIDTPSGFKTKQNLMVGDLVKSDVLVLPHSQRELETFLGERSIEVTSPPELER